MAFAHQSVPYTPPANSRRTSIRSMANIQRPKQVWERQSSGAINSISWRRSSRFQMPRPSITWTIQKTRLSHSVLNTGSSSSISTEPGEPSDSAFGAPVSGTSGRVTVSGVRCTITRHRCLAGLVVEGAGYRGNLVRGSACCFNAVQCIGGLPILYTCQLACKTKACVKLHLHGMPFAKALLVNPLSWSTSHATGYVQDLVGP